ncbi:hypothetical protein [Thalassobaculum sp.]|uniref:hypothetical protein n=1 Tax=Thalassobaculum sp. TaxID=2022740 RepID=UPI003B5C6633
MAGRFKAGDIFDLPFPKAVFQINAGNVEPILDLRDRVAPMPRDGSALADAYLLHMRNEPEIAADLDEHPRAIGSLKFGVRHCMKPPKWSGPKEPRRRRVSHSDWMADVRPPSASRRVLQYAPPPTAPEELYWRAVRSHRLAFARFCFFEQLRDGRLLATGIPEDLRHDATRKAIPSIWWTWDVGIKIRAGQIFERAADGDGWVRAWREVRVSRAKLPARARGSKGGRPSSKDLILEEFDRRKSAGTVQPTLSAEANDLSIWLANHHPDAPGALPKTIEGHIRSIFNAYWQSVSSP